MERRPRTPNVSAQPLGEVFGQCLTFIARLTQSDLCCMYTELFMGTNRAVVCVLTLAHSPCAILAQGMVPQGPCSYGMFLRAVPCGCPCWDSSGHNSTSFHVSFCCRLALPHWRFSFLCVLLWCRVRSVPRRRSPWISCSSGMGSLS